MTDYGNYGVKGNEINIHSRSVDPRARALSALANRAFEVDDQMFASFEGFFNSIKWPTLNSRRRYAAASCFGKAQRYGEGAQTDWVWWKGMKTAAGSPEHLALIRRAHWESIRQSPEATEALLATGDLVITHYIHPGPVPDSPYPAELFCAELTEFRERLRREFGG